MHIVCAFADFYLGIRKNAGTLTSMSRLNDAVIQFEATHEAGTATIESSKMTETTKRPSAQILEFPRGGRTAISSHRSGNVRALDFSDVGYDHVACGGCWYHDEAVTDAKKLREH